MNDKKRILEMLNEGKITVDEAVSLLEAIGEKNAAETAKASQKGKKGDFDEKTTRVLEDVGKKVNTFVENLSQYIQEGLSKVGDQISGFSTFDKGFGFGGRRYRFEDKFNGPIKDGALIKIKSNGPVLIQGTDQDEFQLGIVKMVRAEDEQKASLIADQTLDFTATDEQLLLNLLDKRELWLETVLYLPRKFQYTIEIQSINGKLSLVDLDLLTARLETVNGRIGVEKCEADYLELKTLNGSIDVAGDFDIIDANTHNGSIEYFLTKGNTKAIVKSTNGSVRVRLPVSQSIDYNLEASTGWGKMTIDLPVKDLKLNRDGDNFMQATTVKDSSFEPKEQSIHLKAFTSNGSITIVPLD